MIGAKSWLVVVNLMGVSAWQHVLRWMNDQGQEYRWFEDDMFEQPVSMKDSQVAEWIKRGFLEVRRG